MPDMHFAAAVCAVLIQQVGGGMMQRLVQKLTGEMASATRHAFAQLHSRQTLVQTAGYRPDR